ncbi:PDR/VanB family oxidoreductase [Gordonia malaquae]|uniref:PDR/VanB family oxidoreductase n=2 Tax=Gordonia malaquae TaxID=410332 RepID=UPI0030FE7AC8
MRKTKPQRTLRPPVENEKLTEWVQRTSTRISPLVNVTLPPLVRTVAKYSETLHVGRTVPAHVSAQIPVRVHRREAVSPDGSVASLVLEHVDGRPLPRWFPGAHIDLTLPSGLQRQYSLCGNLTDHGGNLTDHGRYRIAVRLITDGRGGSSEVHSLREGDTLTVSHPRNAFPFAPVGHGDTGHRKIRFVAAGIGITPILPMAESAQRLGLDWTLLYLGRSRESMAFTERVEALGNRAVIRADDTDGTPTIRKILGRVRPETAIFVCGPEPLIEAVLKKLAKADQVEVHFERFSAPPIVDGRPFRIVLASSGEVIDVASDQSMLDAILAARPGTVHSCKQGFCGTCRLKVIQGEPDHRDSLLTPSERADGEILPCVSRAGQTLTVDL